MGTSDDCLKEGADLSSVICKTQHTALIPNTFHIDTDVETDGEPRRRNKRWGHREKNQETRRATERVKHDQDHPRLQGRPRALARSEVNEARVSFSVSFTHRDTEVDCTVKIHGYSCTCAGASTCGVHINTQSCTYVGRYFSFKVPLTVYPLLHEGTISSVTETRLHRGLFPDS